MKERLRGLLEQVLLIRLLYGQLSCAEKGESSPHLVRFALLPALSSKPIRRRKNSITAYRRERLSACCILCVFRINSSLIRYLCLRAYGVIFRTQRQCFSVLMSVETSTATPCWSKPGHEHEGGEPCVLSMKVCSCGMEHQTHPLQRKLFKLALISPLLSVSSQ